MRGTKAEITTQQIVMLIILIASFLVILFFIFQLGFKEETAKEICHNSVVSRASGVLPKETTPLNCKTNYLCITKDGSCEKLSGTFETQRVSTQNEVYKVLADEMVDCWQIYGEGKLNYIGETFTKDLYCSICSQVAFDNSLDMFENNEIDQKDFYLYLEQTKLSSKEISYLKYLTEIDNVQTIENALKENDLSFWKIDLSKQYFILMGIYSEVGAEQWAAGGAGIGFVAGSLIFGPIGGIAGGIIGGIGSFFVGLAVNGDSGFDYMIPTIIEANSEDYDQLNCASIKTLA